MPDSVARAIARADAPVSNPGRKPIRVVTFVVNETGHTAMVVPEPIHSEIHANLRLSDS